jgi:hypothetical protein
MLLRARQLPSLLVSIGLLAVLGCGRNSVHPTSAVSPAGPLLHGGGAPPYVTTFTVGNHCFYTRRTTIRIVSHEGVPLDTTVVTGTKDVRIVGIKEIAGRSYAVEQDVIREMGQPDVRQELDWRQDESGLYLLEAPLREAASLESGSSSRALRLLGHRMKRGLSQVSEDSLSAKLASVAPVLEARLMPGRPQLPVEELVRLRYPLRANAAWTVRQTPRLTARVEALETLDLPTGPTPAWRIQFDSERLGPHDRVHMWYGPAGCLATRIHLETEAVDQSGNPIGTAVLRFSQKVSANPPPAPASQQLQLIGSMSEIPTSAQGDCSFLDANTPWIFSDDSDGNESWSEMIVRGDGDVRGIATWDINWPITPYTAGEYISSVVIGIRSQATSTDWNSPAEAYIRPCINRVGFGERKYYVQNTDYDWTWWTFPVDPRTGEPWSIDALNASRFGFEIHAASSNETYRSWTSVRFSEYRITVNRGDSR